MADDLDVASPSKSQLFRDSEKLVKLAEGLQSQLEGYERTLLTLTLMGASILVTLICIIASLFAIVDSINYRISIATLMSGYTIICLVYLYVRWSETRRLISRDRRALFQIVNMLREVFHSLQVTEGLSTLEVAELRIRLARFDVGD